MRSVGSVLVAVFAILVVGCGGGDTSQEVGTDGEVASTGDGSGEVTVGQMDFSSWMTNIPNVDRATLRALTLPGTHDAGSYYLRNVIAPTGDGEFFRKAICDYDILFGLGNAIGRDAAKEIGHRFGRTQSHNIYEQLEQGIRFFDLRVAYSVDDFYFHHGLLGPKMESIFSQIRDFMENKAGSKEVVIISLAHLYENTKSYQLSLNKDLPCSKPIYQDMSLQHKQDLAEMMEEYLGNYLYRKSEPGDEVQNSRIGKIVKDGPKVIPLYGFGDEYWPGVMVNSKWSNKDKPDELRVSQQEHMDEHYGSNVKRLLENQWILTAQPSVVTKCTECYLWKLFSCDTVFPPPSPVCLFLPDCSSHDYHSVHNLSEMINPHLDGFIYEPDQWKTNIIRVDFFEDSSVVDIALDHPVAVCEDMTVSAGDQCTAQASVDGGSSDPVGGDITLGQDPPGPYSLGKTLVDLKVSDGQLYSECSGTVTVEDTQGPNIDYLAAFPESLWPPNHKMVPVSIDVSVTDACDPNPMCRIVQVQSDETVGKGEGTGNTEPDWIITGDLDLELCAERSGMNDGREYEITVECVDFSGNNTFGSVIVEIPKSASR